MNIGRDIQIKENGEDILMKTMNFRGEEERVINLGMILQDSTKDHLLENLNDLLFLIGNHIYLVVEIIQLPLLINAFEIPPLQVEIAIRIQALSDVTCKQTPSHLPNKL